MRDSFFKQRYKNNFTDASLKKEKVSIFKFDGGVLEFVDFLDEKEKLQNKNGNDLLKADLYEGKKDNIELECSLNGMQAMPRIFLLTLIIFIKKMVFVY